MSEKSVYLAGPINGLTWDAATDWRTEVTKDLNDVGIRVFDPFRGKSFLKSYIREQGKFSTNALIDRQLPDDIDHPIVKGHGIVHRDLYDVRHVDLVLVNFVGATAPSIGTIVEIATAFHNQKYILVAMEPGNVHSHPFITELASMVVPTLEEAVLWVPIILLGRK